MPTGKHSGESWPSPLGSRGEDSGNHGEARAPFHGAQQNRPLAGALDTAQIQVQMLSAVPLLLHFPQAGPSREHRRQSTCLTPCVWHAAQSHKKETTLPPPPGRSLQAPLELHVGDRSQISSVIPSSRTTASGPPSPQQLRENLSPARVYTHLLEEPSPASQERSDLRGRGPSPGGRPGAQCTLSRHMERVLPEVSAAVNSKDSGKCMPLL